MMHIDHALLTISSMDNFVHATTGKLPSDSKATRHLVRVEPIDTYWKVTHTVLMSDHIAQLVFDRIRLLATVQLSDSLTRCLADPDSRGKASALYKQGAHWIFRQGGTFKLQALTKKRKSKTITLSPTGDTMLRFYYTLNIHEAPNSQSVHPTFLDLYMTPVAKTEESIDSLWISHQHVTFLFQMTVSDRHSVKFRGLDAVFSRLPAKAKREVCIVFVKPTEDGSQNRFKEQSIDISQYADADKVTQFEHFPQYICWLDI